MGVAADVDGEDVAEEGKQRALLEAAGDGSCRPISDRSRDDAVEVVRAAPWPRAGTGRRRSETGSARPRARTASAVRQPPQ
jgi:hypothetical protein